MHIEILDCLYYKDYMMTTVVAIEDKFVNTMLQNEL